MWHEARKQEKKIREAVVDFQKRAERRRQHYAKERKDPMQLMRVYGRKTPLHLNPAASKMSSSMIPWQGDEANMISRYDVRVNLDYIPDYSKLPKPTKSVSEEWEEQRCNYERYRFLVLNQFKRVSEQDALAVIDVEEMFHIPGKSSGGNSGGGFREKAKSQARAAIGYSYGGTSEEAAQAMRDEQLLAEYLGEDDGEGEDKVFSSESEYEVDVDLDDYSPADVDRLNVLALEYGVAASSFSKNLRTEKKSMEEAKQARISDIEKASMPGRRSRRERRQMRERAPRRVLTPPTYAQRGSPTYETYNKPEQRSRSSSRSSTPGEGKVEFITEFGGDDEGGGANQPLGHAHQSGSREAVPKSGRDGRSGAGERRGRNSQSSRHRSRSRSPRRRNSRSPRRRNSHSHSLRRRDSRSHSPRQRDSHSRSPRRRDSRSRGRDTRSRSRDSSHKRSHRSSSRERKRQRSGSQSRDQDHTHQSFSGSQSREQDHTHQSFSGSQSREQDHTHQSSSSSSTSVTASSEATPPSKNKLPQTSKATNKPTKEKAKLTPQERLKKKMQAQLSRQFKQDKKLQKEREYKKESERIGREEEMRDQMRRIKERDRSNCDREGRISRSPSPYGYTSAHYGRYM
ncbi:CLK4-associating serine/arginine rich protein [Geodia barretti]|uniref:CLK4-associating serine/arginine rich protein n=1 Tax=Geodia barretti TaxID=519541 RepID=A0AA35X2Y0_GEOBA|nr:CLK4-associating serine/arginine rich protein [Geodia barretti]